MIIIEIKDRMDRVLVLIFEIYILFILLAVENDFFFKYLS